MRHLTLILLLALLGCQHTQTNLLWKTMYFSVLGSDVMLWRTASGDECVLATGSSQVINRLRQIPGGGRAQLLVEMLPAPERLPQLPPGRIIFDRKVLIPGVPVEPQCESSKVLYWIVDFRYLDPFPPS
jgi:hypothetical protein